MQRTFGWIQNPSSIETLHNVVSIFNPSSEFVRVMLEERLPFLLAADLYTDPALHRLFCNAIRHRGTIAYDLLKGKGAGKGKRADAKCSGLVQAAIDGQQTRRYVVNGQSVSKKKPYTDDWTADGFVRWAVSLGFIEYDANSDTCALTESGRRFSLAEKGTPDFYKELGDGFLKYPPVWRVLSLLSSGVLMSKFEIGSQLGFKGEDGFTSIPQHLWVQEYAIAQKNGDRDTCSEMRSNYEGSSDKYARMICAWLKQLGWVEGSSKDVSVTIGQSTYSCKISPAYKISKKGLEVYNAQLAHRSSKIVYSEMLATKAPDTEYLRQRRSLILDFIKSGDYDVVAIQKYLQGNGINEPIQIIANDLDGFTRIGLNIEKNANAQFSLHDNITNLTVNRSVPATATSDVSTIKSRLAEKLQHVDFRFLTLVDLAFSGSTGCRDFEILTVDLFTNELGFEGMHLGGTRKPDGIISYDKHGVIIDNKAYSKGFTITRQMSDEMIRYCQENQERSATRNPLCWWNEFPEQVNYFSFMFVSSLFKGEVESALRGISAAASGIKGTAITAEQLLEHAELMKVGEITRYDFLLKVDTNKVFA